MIAPEYPGAVAPERSFRVDCDGIHLQIYEWGDPNGEPLLLAHGLWDTGRGFDTLAPLLADRFRVVAYDARGHGNSDQVDTYTWPSDLRDQRLLIDWLAAPVRLVGHSRGGNTLLDTASLFPDGVVQVVSIDGFGPPKGGFKLPGEEDYEPGDPAVEMAEYLDARRRLASRPAAWRPRKQFDDLVERRAAQNPRLPPGWLRYFAYHCAKQTPEGWIWKVDPRTTHGFGPFRPDWIAPRWRSLKAPMLAITGDTVDAFGPCDDETLTERLRFIEHSERAVVANAGHFVHMERPTETARLLLDFLAS